MGFDYENTGKNEGMNISHIVKNAENDVMKKIRG